MKKMAAPGDFCLFLDASLSSLQIFVNKGLIYLLIKPSVYKEQYDSYNEKKKMKRIINFQQMIRCKEVLLRKDWRIIYLLRVAGLQEDGPG